MPYKCSVYGCQTKYDKKKYVGKEKEEVHLFSFPVNDAEKDRWIKSLPNVNFSWTVSKRLCEKHWLPTGFTTKVINRNGTLGPTEPPSVFQGVPPSCVPNKSSKKRESLSSSGYREDLQSPSRYRGDEPQSSVECSENTDNRYESLLCYDEV